MIIGRHKEEYRGFLITNTATDQQGQVVLGFRFKAKPLPNTMPHAVDFIDGEWVHDSVEEAKKAIDLWYSQWADEARILAYTTTEIIYA